MRHIILCALLFAACEPGEATGDTFDSWIDTQGAPSGARTLDNCATSLASDLPTFFSRYFHCVDITLDGDHVNIATVGLPPHPSAYHSASDPNYIAFDTQGGERRQNPNRIAGRTATLDIPLSPVPRGITVTASMINEQRDSGNEFAGDQGVALNGVFLYAGYAGPGHSLSMEQFSFDRYNGHPQQEGSYHYHGASPGPLEVLERKGIVSSADIEQAEIQLYGIMCDGTVVMGCTELDGSTPTGSMDAQFGHEHDLVDGSGETLLADRYHTHVCPGVFSDFTPEVQFYEGGDACEGFGGPGGPALRRRGPPPPRWGPPPSRFAEEEAPAAWELPARP